MEIPGSQRRFRKDGFLKEPIVESDYDKLRGELGNIVLGNFMDGQLARAGIPTFSNFIVINDIPDFMVF